jgi:hypothetical protein
MRTGLARALILRVEGAADSAPGYSGAASPALECGLSSRECRL